MKNNIMRFYLDGERVKKIENLEISFLNRLLILFIFWKPINIIFTGKFLGNKIKEKQA